MGAATHVRIVNHDAVAVMLHVESVHAMPEIDKVLLRPGERRTVRLAAVAAHRWYDVTLSAADGSRHCLAGHWENGLPGISEPTIDSH